MKKAFYIFMIFAFLTGHIAFAEDTEHAGTAPLYTFPEMSPEFDIHIGYRFLDYDESKRAEEFEYLDEDSVTAAADLRIFQMPHRLHLDVDVKNKYDFFGDLSYAYKDLLLFRGIQRNIFHNYGNIDLNPTGLGTADQRDSRDEEYDARVGITDVSLRLKAPDHPLHVFGKAHFVNKEGTVQQRFIGGAGWFNNLIRTTEKRDIDWETEEYQVGINSHLRWIEAEYSYSQKNFHAGGDDEPYYSYTQAGFGPPPGTRAAGTYPHNVISETKGYSHTAKVHTNYTGKIVASATFSTKKRENEYSDAEARYTFGSGSITYMPLTPLTFFIKYKHSERDMDNPDSVTIADRNNPSNTYGDSDVRDSVSATTDRISLIGRYRPVSKLTLKAGYEFENHTRDDYEDWHVLEKSTKKNSFSLSADTRITSAMKLKLKYKHMAIQDPSYNVDPDSSNEGKATLSWLVHPRVNTMMSYSIAREKRKDMVIYDDTIPTIVELPNDRKVDRDMFFGTVTFIVIDDLSLTASYANMNYKIKEDLYFHDGAGVPQLDEKVPYTDSANNYGANIQYWLNDRLDLNGSVSYTTSKAKFKPENVLLTDTDSVADLSELETRETIYSVSASYKIIGGFILGALYRYSDFDDVGDNPWDDTEDGTAQIIWLTVSKKWG